MSQETKPDCGTSCVSRRLFLAAAGAGTATMLLGELFPGRVLGQSEQTPVEVTTLPRKRIAALADLQPDQPVKFQYPGEGELQNCLLVKLGRKAGGGTGPEQDIVAFSGRCTHMGASLDDDYRSEFKVLGPCSLHLTTFDLTRHGLVVAGHATEALPQILLEIDGNDVYATGIAGLLYGYSRNV